MSTIDPTQEQIDVVGLNKANNGRSCDRHSCCGLTLRVGMVVRFSRVTVSINGHDEFGIAVYRLADDGSNGCCVGFLKKFMLRRHAIFEGVQARVIHILTDETSSTPEVSERAFQHHNYGSAKVICITPKNKPAQNEKKRPEDCCVLVVQKKRIKMDTVVKKEDCK